MCWPAALAALGTGAGSAAAGATAAGATAAAGLGQTLQVLGLVASVGGSVAQGIAASNAAKTQAALTEKQAAIEKQLTATEDQRRRQQFRSQIAAQRAELAARGIAADSPTAILLGQVAATEMSFNSQAVRQSGAAKVDELSAVAAASRADAANSVINGSVSAVGKALTAAPDIWPGLSSGRVLG